MAVESTDVDAITFILASIACMNMLGGSMVAPLLPYIALKYHADPVSLAGMSSVFSMMAAIGGPIVGALSDRLGHKCVLLGCLVGSISAFCVLGLVDNIESLIIARAFHGFFFDATTGLCQAFVADLVHIDERADRLGKIMAALGLGIVMGPAIGGAI